MIYSLLHASSLAERVKGTVCCRLNKHSRVSGASGASPTCRRKKLGRPRRPRVTPLRPFEARQLRWRETQCTSPTPQQRRCSKLHTPTTSLSGSTQMDATATGRRSRELRRITQLRRLLEADDQQRLLLPTTHAGLRRIQHKLEREAAQSRQRNRQLCELLAAAADAAPTTGPGADVQVRPGRRLVCFSEAAADSAVMKKVHLLCHEWAAGATQSAACCLAPLPSSVNS